ncbi:NADPH-dependent FMN reductase [Aliikangiella sp. IMCC44359]|uniref:NADPH-dependent FMN reductase n=1 Tax=Aliikangiella sp. IMCC44359 TaxID=3459125 RepID=UPI00403B22FB
MKLIGFAASSSKASINKQLVTYTFSLLKDVDHEILDLNDYELPLFSVDKEQELGQPELAQKFLSQLGKCDGIVISFAEHNGSYSAAYKNLFDWCSRINPKVFQNKPMLLLATSPGARGGASVLEAAVKSAPFFSGDVKASLSIPSFNDNFDVDKGELINQELKMKLVSAVESLMVTV